MPKVADNSNATNINERLTQLSRVNSGQSKLKGSISNVPDSFINPSEEIKEKSN